MEKQKKQVAIFSRWLTLNGANKALVEMLRRLDYSLLEIDLYLLEKGNADPYLYAMLPPEVHIVQVPSYKKDRASFINILKYPCHFLKAVKAGKDLHHEKMIYQWKGTAKRLPKISKKYDVAISFRHYDIDVFYVLNNMEARKKFFWIHGVQPLEKEEVKLLHSVYQKYDQIFPVSETAKANFQKFFPDLVDRCTVAYCIVDATEIRKRAFEKVDFEFSVDGGGLQILTIGRLNQEKGISLAVQAAKILHEKQIAFQWSIIGDGDRKAEIKHLIKKYGLEKEFRLLGQKQNPYPYLKNCDIYVQPSHLESYGLSVNEAKIFAKPIVCTDIPAMREQLKNEYTALLVRETAEGLAEGILKLATDKNLRLRLSENLKENEYSHFEVISIITDAITK